MSLICLSPKVLQTQDKACGLLSTEAIVYFFTATKKELFAFLFCCVCLFLTGKELPAKLSRGVLPCSALSGQLQSQWAMWKTCTWPWKLVFPTRSAFNLWQWICNHKEKKELKKRNLKKSQPGCAHRKEIWKIGLNVRSPFSEGPGLKVLLRWLVTKYMPELLPSNANHPSILAFHSSSHIPFPSSEWWLPRVIKYSTSQQGFIKKEVHEFLKLFCKSLWELTMKANTSAGVQLPSYPRIQPDTGICGILPLWCVRNSLEWSVKGIAPLSA